MARARLPVLDPSTRVDAEPVDPEPEGSVSSRPDWLARGEAIGRYEIRECLGVGGMGVIYSAFDPELGRKLAIKVVRTRHGKLGSARGRARLLREGQALARLRHPNVITVHDVGTHDDRVFVAMEFVEGETLQRWLLRSPRAPLDRVIDVFLQVGRGLAAAHRAGLVHRDVKPENVMISEDDGRVLVLDFGIAREGYGSESDAYDEAVLDDDLDSDKLRAIAAGELELPEFGRVEAPDPDPRKPGATAADNDDELLGAPEPLLGAHTPLADLTRAGAVLGTPAYMSPEQHRGRPVDARSDQFSFCVAMWEALHGEKPFGEGSRQKLLARMRLGQIKRPRNREVHRRINHALRRGLAWKPGERFAAMERLLEALNPRGPSAEQRLWRGLTLGALAGMLLGVLGTLSSLSLRDRDAGEPRGCDRGRSEIAAHWSPARSEALARRFEATGLAHASASWLRTHDRLDDWAARWVAARDQACAAHFLDQLDSAARHDARVECLDRQRQHFVELLDRLDRVDAVLVERAVVSSLRLPAPELCADPTYLRELVDHEVPGSASVRQRVAELGQELDGLSLILDDLRLDEAALQPGLLRDELGRGRELLAEARELDVRALIAQALLVHGSQLAAVGTASEASAALFEAARVAAALGDDELQARALAGAALQLAVLGQSEPALMWLEHAAALAETLADPTPIEVAVLIARARAIRVGRPHDPTLAAHDALVEARARIEALPALEPLLPEVLVLLARANLDRAGAPGDAERSVELLRRALSMTELERGSRHPRVAAIRTSLAEALARTGKTSAALGEHERALLAWEQLQRWPEATRQRGRIGALLARQARCAEAWPLLPQAVDEARARAPRSLLLAELLELLAGACSASHADAPRLAREAVELRRQLQGPDHPELAGALEVEALALLATDQPGPALARLDRAELLREQAQLLPSPEAIAARGLILAALGEREQAREQLEYARPRLAPDSELAPRVRDELLRLR